MPKSITLLAFIFASIATMSAQKTNTFKPFSLEQATEHWVIGEGKQAIKYSAYVGVDNKTDTCVVIELKTKWDITFNEKTNIITNFVLNDMDDPDSDDRQKGYVTSYLKESSVTDYGYRLVFTVSDNFIRHWNCLVKSVSRGEFQSCTILTELNSIFVRKESIPD